MGKKKKTTLSDTRDEYYPVRTGDTFDSIAKDLGHEGEGQKLLDASHGAETNGDLAAAHARLISGTDEPKEVKTTTKLTEGQSLLLPKGWSPDE